MNQFEELQTLTHVVETGSISRAAERLGVAKSAVSRRLSDLEQRLGVQLFQRTTRQMNLTDSGRSFYDRAVQILADLKEAELAVSQQHTDLRGKLRVAAPLSFGLQHLSQAIIEFNQRHPDIIFDVDFNDRQIDLLEEGFDMAIRIAQLDDSSLIARKIAPVRQTICASPGYLQKYGVPEKPEDLTSHNCLVYSNISNPSNWKFVDNNGDTIKVTVPVALSANNGEFLHSAALADRGIVMMPNFIIYQSLQSKKLVPLLEAFETPSINAYALYPQTRHLSYRVRAFVDFLVTRFQGLPYWETNLPTQN